MFRLTLILFIVIIICNVFIEIYITKTADEFKAAAEAICSLGDADAQAVTDSIKKLNAEFSAKRTIWELTVNREETELAAAALKKAEIAGEKKDFFKAVSEIKLFMYFIDNISQNFVFW